MPNGLRGIALGLAAGFAVLPANAAAQEIEGAGVKQFAVEGAGRLDCATFVDARNDRGSAEYQRLIGFVEGFLSAANLYEDNTFDLSPWHNAAGFDLILSAHCEKHPDEVLASVAQRMISSFRPLRLAEFSPMIEVGSGENSTVIYETILKRAQSALARLGYYSGPETGEFNGEVRAGFLAFQQAHELDQTGIPDPVTLWTLLDP